MKILLVGDDGETVAVLMGVLSSEGLQIEFAFDMELGLLMARSGDYDAVIVDRTLPDGNCLHLLSQVRESGSRVPVIIVSASPSIDERVHGLNSGADDYLSKPIATKELLAQLRAIHRRRVRASSVLRVGDLKMDLVAREVTRDGRQIRLSNVEFKVLECLMRNAGRVVTQLKLKKDVWSNGGHQSSALVHVHVARTRAKTNKGFEENLIENVHGVGYKMPFARVNLPESEASCRTALRSLSNDDL